MHSNLLILVFILYILTLAVIPSLSLGGGALVLAQEQDQRGEGFNPAESFVGSLSQLNIWDYPLSPEQVNK